MKGLKIAGPALAVFAAAIGLAQYHPLGNPRSVPQQTRAELLKGVRMSVDARRVLIEKCANCHSNATSWPIYSNIAPLSWIIERDVLDGRERLNLSNWQSLPPDRQETLSEEIVREIRRSSMPPVQYRLVHWNSRMYAADEAALVALAPEQADDQAAGPGDASRGKLVFEHRCTGCHALDSNREGPHLRGVYGRAAGTVPDFEYSAAIRKSGIVWNDATIERWLRDTDDFIAGNNMGFRVPKAQDRADVIAFLKTVR